MPGTVNDVLAICNPCNWSEMDPISIQGGRIGTKAWQRKQAGLMALK
jgi:hypothetical protein